MEASFPKNTILSDTPTEMCPCMTTSIQQTISIYTKHLNERFILSPFLKKERWWNWLTVTSTGFCNFRVQQKAQHEGAEEGWHNETVSRINQHMTKMNIFSHTALKDIKYLVKSECKACRGRCDAAPQETPPQRLVWPSGQPRGFGKAAQTNLLYKSFQTFVSKTRVSKSLKNLNAVCVFAAVMYLCVQPCTLSWCVHISEPVSTTPPMGWRRSTWQGESPMSLNKNRTNSR